MSKTSDWQQTRRELEWSDLAVILAIGRAGSLSGAARALGKTHSTVFRNIKAIEERTGVQFFDSVDHGYLPTDAGRVALEYAERVEGEFHALGIEVLGLDTKLRGRVRIACPESPAHSAPVLRPALRSSSPHQPRGAEVDR
jgi:DNA-binding transcriptional LysR family regulator